ncbi:hypothetical protein AVEN_169921-1 [Araneus ventricosus]|uniref:Uncharacterized protein n=1 Tax=Araneus ventricosus TaxID=182803 RepID=A0A4Y2EYP8_ARAVE|nr:hypothetical protein AVEN_169921-1 [Araneus ventricosus]
MKENLKFLLISFGQTTSYNLSLSSALKSECGTCKFYKVDCHKNILKMPTSHYQFINHRFSTFHKFCAYNCLIF